MRGGCGGSTGWAGPAESIRPAAFGDPRAGISTSHGARPDPWRSPSKNRYGRRSGWPRCARPASRVGALRQSSITRRRRPRHRGRTRLPDAACRGAGGRFAGQSRWYRSQPGRIRPALASAGRRCLPALLQGAFGSKSWTARLLGAEGGRARSVAKAAASRRNGRNGGWPKKAATPWDRRRVSGHADDNEDHGYPTAL